MKLTIPVNWEDDYFDKIDFSETEEIYGKLNVGLIGGGRPTLTLPNVKKEKVKDFVDEAHRRNLKFNYLMNGTCFDNLEITKTGYKDIRKTLDWLAENNVDGISVSLPMVMEIIKKNYPQFSISASLQFRIVSFKKARYWENL
ncbi:MAG TPA: U32 family peptidase, partial [Chitinophagaceae bacterium]|nr:U32 family peptidase [Chitinophagaceae bacterium]